MLRTFSLFLSLGTVSLRLPYARLSSKCPPLGAGRDIGSRYPSVNCKAILRETANS